MSGYFDSLWVERIGWALLQSFWQILIVSVVYGFLRLVFRSPNVRHFLGMVALVACLMWPVISLIRSLPQRVDKVRSDAPSAVAQNDLTEPKSVGPVVTVGEGDFVMKLATGTTTTRAVGAQVLPWLVGGWSCGLLLLLLRHGGALWSLHRIRTRGVVAASGSLAATFERLKTQMVVKRSVKLLTSIQVKVPLVIGTLRPVVVLPLALIAQLDRRQIEALIAHELAHLKRWDDVCNLVQCAVVTILYHHPLVWWISRLVRQDRELCTDDLALDGGVERGTLAQALAALALDGQPEPQPSLAAHGHGPLVHRIKRLLLPEPAPRTAINLWPVVAVLVGMFVVSLPAKAEPEQVRGRILDRNGKVLAVSDAKGRRSYPQKTLAAHVVGYTMRRHPNDDSDRKGAFGVEASFDAALSAKTDVKLTIDAELQEHVEKLLSTSGCRGGACVVLDPRTGEVLSMASWPTYDPSKFEPTILKEGWEELSRNERLPLFFRANQGTYYPGTVFNAVTTLAALESGSVTKDSTFEGVPALDVGGRTYRNWTGQSQGQLDVVSAIAKSSNTWMYQAALKTGAGPIAKMATEFGLGATTGVTLPDEAAGFLPTDEQFHAKYGRKLLPGDIASMSIGSLTTSTPIQIAVMTSAIATGRVWTPQLVTGNDVSPKFRELKVKKQHLDLVRKGMIAKVNTAEGTGQRGKLDDMTVAGLTGSNVWKIYRDASRNQKLAWFTGYAPADDPQIVVTVLCEGFPGQQVFGSTSAAPIAKAVFEKAFEMNPPKKLERGTGAKDDQASSYVPRHDAPVTLLLPDGSIRDFSPWMPPVQVEDEATLTFEPDSYKVDSTSWTSFYEILHPLPVEERLGIPWVPIRADFDRLYEHVDPIYRPRWDLEPAVFDSETLWQGLPPIGPIRIDFDVPVESDEFNHSSGVFDTPLIAS